MFTQMFSFFFFSCISKFLSTGIHVLSSSHSIPSWKISKCCLCFDTIISQGLNHIVISARTISVGEAQPTPPARCSPRSCLVQGGNSTSPYQHTGEQMCTKSNHEHCQFGEKWWKPTLLSWSWAFQKHMEGWKCLAHCSWGHKCI